MHGGEVGAAAEASVVEELVFACAWSILRAETKFVAHFTFAASDKLVGGVCVISFVRASGEVVVSVVLEMSFCCWGGGVVLMVLVAEVVVLVAEVVVLVAGVLVAGVVVVAVVVPVACLVGDSLGDLGVFLVGCVGGVGRSVVPGVD